MSNSTTIVILNWNGAEDTLGCLTSLREAGYLDLPVIVVDNGSRDDSPERIAEAFPKVELLALEKNRGFAGGCNAGLELALARGAAWICLLNNDTAVEPGFLEILREETKRRNRVGIAAPQVRYAGRRDTVWSQGITVKAALGRILTPSCGKPAAELDLETREYPAVSGAALLLSRRCLETVGGFDPDYFLCYEDVDICLRAREAGFKVLAVPRAVVYHKVSASMGGEGSDAIIYYSTRNQLLVLRKRLPLTAIGNWIRGLLVAGYTLLFTLITSRTPLRRGLRTWGKGVLDYWRGRWGPRREKPER